MAHGYEVYIDEAGCEGFKFRPRPEPGSPEWFIIGAVVWRTDQRQAILSHIRAAKDRIAPQRKHMHFLDLSHDQKVAWIDAFAQSGATALTVMVDKPRLAHPEIFQKKDRLYCYATRLLLERISWFCRDSHQQQPSGDGSANITFSKRKAMSYDDLLSYLRVLNRQAEKDAWLRMLVNDIRIHWPAIRESQIAVRPHMDLLGLQLADAVCGAVRAALEYSNYGFTEHRFAKMLPRAIYSRNGNHRSYGLKFFPGPPKDAPGSRPRYGWVAKHYPR